MTFRHIFPTFALLCAAACSENYGPDHIGGGKVKAVIGGIQPQTRTSLDPDGTAVRWSVGDRIAVWATNGTEFALNAEPFTLYTYNSLYSSADFSTTINEMTPATYTYYAVYPQPASTNGTSATYELAAVQGNGYEGAHDIMVAEPITCGALEASPHKQPALSFRHLLHMVRIEIPSGRNLMGTPIKRIEATFPTEVTGTVTFDATNPEATLEFSDGSRTLTIDIAGKGMEGRDGEYVYAFIRPCDMDGQITFRAYDEQGYCSYSISSQPISKQLAAGHTTPISITIPERRVLQLDLSETANNLGEVLTNITVNLPEGFSFINGQNSQTITPASDGHYYASMYFNTALLGEQISIDYESANALLSGYKLPLPTQVAEHENAAVSFTVPYLFEEDFSNASDYSNDDNNTTSLTSAGSNDAENIHSLAGWTGARCGVAAGKALRICCRAESFWALGAKYYSYDGRVDSAPLNRLKEGKAVSIQLSFRYSLNRVSSKGSANQHYLTVATHTYAGAQNPTQSGRDKLGSTIRENNPIAKDLTTPNDGSFDNIYQEVSYNAVNCTNKNRFVWESYILSKSPDGYYNNWVYIDDIKVKIVK